MDVELRSAQRAQREQIAVYLIVAIGSALFGTALNRLLFETAFPILSWAGRPAAAIVLSAVACAAGLILFSIARRATGTWLAAAFYLSLFLNISYLLSGTTDPVYGWLLFAISIWLIAVLAASFILPAGRQMLSGPLLLVALLLPVYLLTLGRNVGTADTFEFQVVIPRMGVVHPTGYPLYLLLARLFTFLPVGNPALRVNLATAILALIAVSLLYLFLFRLTEKHLPSVLASLLFGLTPTFWGQAVQAEVYTLHALIVAAALLWMAEIGGWKMTPAEPDDRLQSVDPGKATILLALTLGFGLTNHLTTVILLPAAALTILVAVKDGRYGGGRNRLKLSLLTLAAFILPLFLYAYLPLRWQAVNDEAMGMGRFVEWVFGGRFAGALRLTAWLDDPSRYGVVARLFGYEWKTAWFFVPALTGAAASLLRGWRVGIILLATWLGYLFYGLNYFVPDLSVFIIPAYLVAAVWWGIGLWSLWQILDRLMSRRTSRFVFVCSALVLFGPMMVIAAGDTWREVDRSQDDGRVRWAEAVLALPLEEQAAILADSDKFPPLYYLQQAENIRTDLNILLLPDEAAYRSELDRRINEGQTVYLARYLPGLAGIYALDSAGPLVRASTSTTDGLPAGMIASDLDFGAIRLSGYRLENPSPYAPAEAAITLYWQGVEPIDDTLHVYIRLQGGTAAGTVQGQHPANNFYPTNAWQPGEIVADFHRLELPLLDEAKEVPVEVALGPPFSKSDDLAWQEVSRIHVDAGLTTKSLLPIRLQYGDLTLDGISFPRQVRSGTFFEVIVGGRATAPSDLRFELLPGGPEIADISAQTAGFPVSEGFFVRAQTIQSSNTLGRYRLAISSPGSGALCGWLKPPAEKCIAGVIEVSGAALPDGATNFGDNIALLDVDLPENQLRPGGLLDVNIRWQALQPMTEDYTVFLQVLDNQDRIAGQVDSWPLQGTFPTSQWKSGEIVRDSYAIRLSEELPPGSYRLIIGFYLLETLQRLPVLDQDGQIIDDKQIVPGLTRP